MKRIIYFILLICLSRILYAESNIATYKLTSNNGLPDNDIREILQDKTGYLYFISKYSAYQYDGYDFRQLPVSWYQKHKKQKTYERGDIFRDNHNNLIRIGMDGNLTFHDHKTHEVIHLNACNATLLSHTNTIKIHVISDDRGYIWVSVYGNGLFIYNRRSHELKHFSQYNHDNIINYDYVVCMMQDRMGNIWISQEHYGVKCLKIINQNYKIINIGSSLSELNNIRLLKRLNKNQIIIADNQGGLFFVNDNLQSIQGITSNVPFISACYDDQGRLWLGSRQNGIKIGNRWYSYDRIDCILKDLRGRMWYCGLRKDLVMGVLTPQGKFMEHHFFSKFKGLDPRILINDKKGYIWMGCSQGLIVFNPDKLLANPKAYTKISNLFIHTLYCDHLGSIWIGTAGNGLYYGDSQLRNLPQFHHLSTANGLTNNVIQSLTEDSYHNICIGTEDGCIYYNPDNRKFYTLYLADQPSRNFYNEQAAVRLADGRMAFGSLDGIVVVNRQLPKRRHLPYPLAITNIQINGTSIYDMDDLKSKQGDVARNYELTLSHDKNSVVFKFSDFNYASNYHTSYSYKLDGRDESWSPVSNRNFAEYKDLPSGTYKLQVRYRDNEGDWQTVADAFTITINPPLWASWWAILLYIVILSTIVYFLYRHIKEIYYLRQGIEEEKKMTDFKLRFFTDISHEFRTPLTLIQANVDHINSLKDLPAEIKRSAQSMQQSVNRLLRLINQLLEFRRIQNNKISLDLQETDVTTFLYNIFMNFHNDAENRSTGYQFLPQQKSIKAFIDRGKVDKIVYNLLSNAFKYTPKKGRIILKLWTDSDHLKISVSDTGIGISKEKQGELFQRFTTGKVSADSMGIGLNFSFELARIHHGTIEYETRQSVGSIFTVTLPLNKTAYKAEDFLKTDTGLEDEKVDTDKGFIPQQKDIRIEPMNDKIVLIVEDNMDICELLQSELGKYFIIQICNDGQDAWDKLQQEGAELPDLIISDVLMPRMDGYTLLDKIRKNDQTRAIPVIMLTALSNENNKLKGIDKGADAYISKPFRTNILVAKCANLIKQRELLQQVYAKQPQQKAWVKEVIRDEKDKKFIKQLDVIIENHLSDETLNIDSLAEMFGMGRTTFYKTVKSLTGQSSNEYLKGKRLYKAAELLRTENMTVAEISYKIGMGNPQYLSTNFKKKFGMSPKEYQKGK